MPRQHSTGALRRYIAYTVRKTIKELSIMPAIDDLGAAVTALQAKDALVLQFIANLQAEVTALQAADAAYWWCVL